MLSYININRISRASKSLHIFSAQTAWQPSRTTHLFDRGTLEKRCRAHWFFLMLKSFYWHGIFSAEKVTAEERSEKERRQNSKGSKRNAAPWGQWACCKFAPTLAHISVCAALWKSKVQLLATHLCRYAQEKDVVVPKKPWGFERETAREAITLWKRKERVRDILCISCKALRYSRQISATRRISLEAFTTFKGWPIMIISLWNIIIPP